MTKLTIGVTSCNRSYYTKSILTSLKDVVACDNIQLIVVDNASSENGLCDYLVSCDFIDSLILRKDRNWINDEYIAKNIIIEQAKHDIILFLQDDAQFVGNKAMLINYVNDFAHITNAKCMSMIGVRKVSISEKFDFSRGISSANGSKYWCRLDNHFTTTGLFKKELFEKLGHYPVSWKENDSYWGKSEDYYHKLTLQKCPDQYALEAHVPLFAGIWNDPRGYYSIIRRNRRYGHYIPPQHESGLYYSMLTQDRINTLMKNDIPASFTDITIPLNWDYPRTPDGDQVKYDQKLIIKDGPYIDLYDDEQNDQHMSEWITDN